MAEPKQPRHCLTDVTPSQPTDGGTMYHDRGFAGLPEKQHPSLRDRMRSHRARKYGLFPQRLLVSRTQLDKLEEHGQRVSDTRVNFSATDLRPWHAELSVPGLGPAVTSSL